MEKNIYKIGKELFITNEEEIKDYNWYISSDGKLLQFTGRNVLGDKFIAPKVIITTDQDLIADGVQAIDDEFLEWFCNNSSCERVEIRYTVDFNSKAVIIIPKEEPKQEQTLEEASKEYVNKNYTDYTFKKILESIFIDGAKWQVERSISKEEVINLLNFVNDRIPDLYSRYNSEEEFKDWFEQFKKK